MFEKVAAGMIILEQQKAAEQIIKNTSQKETTVSIEQNKAAVLRFFDEFNRQNRSAFSEILTPDYTLDFPGGPGTAHGIPELLEAAAGFISTFPDLHFTVKNIIAEGDHVATYWTMRATQKGPLGPVPGTNKQIEMTGTSYMRLRDGKICEDRVRADLIGVLQQVGAMPAPEPVGL